MNETINDVRSELKRLIEQKNEIKEQLALVSDDINRKDQELRNILASEFVGKFIKRTIKRNLISETSYGVVHSIVDINTVKVMNVGFTVNNKIARTCEPVDISELILVPESEVSSYIFKSVTRQYEKWRSINE